MSGTLADLHEEWEGLGAKRQSRLEALMFGTPLVLGALALALLAAMASNLGGTVVHLVARTEYIRYTPLGNDPPQWLLENVAISSAESLDDLAASAFFPPTDAGTPIDEGPDAAVGMRDEAAVEDPELDARVAEELFDVFFQPHCGDTIVVSRIGKGPLHIRVSSEREPIITDMRGKASPIPLESIGRTFTFEIPAPEKGAIPDTSVVWPLEGRVDPGRAVGPQTTSQFGLLLEGKVEVVAGRLGTNSTYSVDEHELELGDQVSLPTAYELDALIAAIAEEERKNDADADAPSLCRAFDDSKGAGSIDKGFIHPDDGKGVNVSLSSNARYADIVRYRTAPIQLRSGWFKRLVNDQVISFGWAVIGVGFVFHRRLARLAVVLAGEMKHDREGADTP